MNELKLLHESIVDESEIDSLGHLNVRFYVERAAAANVALLKQVGITPSVNQAIRRVDTYNRFLKEQFAGAKLIVLGGLVHIDGAEGISGYYEIRNQQTNDLTATFVITSKLFNQNSDDTVPMIELDEETMQANEVQIPPQGQPRSLSLSPPKHVTFEEIAAMIPDDIEPGNMNGRREGTVIEEDCDDQGRLREDVDPMFVMFRPQPGEELKNMGPPITRDEEGRRYSFAMMEIRAISFSRPNLGDKIVSLSADVNFGEKWRHTRRWLFNLKSGDLLGISDQAAVCLDLDARKAIPIPADLRQVMEKNCLRDFI